MFKEVMNDLWLARISSLSNEVGLYVVLLEVLLFMHESLRKVISHGPKFRESQHINWKHNFKIIMDAVEDYARRWIKRESRSRS
jgi:hypothetical protein